MDKLNETTERPMKKKPVVASDSNPQIEPDENPNFKKFSAKNVSLLALILQQVALVLMIRYSRLRTISDTDTEDTNLPYLASVVVVSAECFKFLLNLALERSFVEQDRGNNSAVFATLWNNLYSRESFKLFVPALLYLIQNNLLFVALTNLSVPVYQVTNQGKLLTTAFFTRILLNKNISQHQYSSLFVLALGVAIVQLSSANKSQHNTSSADNETDTETHTVELAQNQWIGMAAVIISCITSGFAGVYFEKVLKHKSAVHKQVSVYMRNIQLSFWSIFLGFIPIYISDDWDKVKENGVFQGFNSIVWTVIVFQAMTGLIVGFVFKYADAILKGFATSVAVVVATVLSIFIFDVQVDQYFFIGAALVVFSVHTYAKHPHISSPTSKSATNFSVYRSFLLPMVLILVLLLGDFDFYSNVTESWIPKEFKDVKDVKTDDYGDKSINGTIAHYSGDKSINGTIAHDSGNNTLSENVENNTLIENFGNNTITDVLGNDTLADDSGNTSAVESLISTCEIEEIPPVPGRFQNVVAKWDKRYNFIIFHGTKMEYMRSGEEWENKKSRGESCASTIDVLSWIADRVECFNGTLMIGYGELIHLHREKALIKPDGEYFDDDFDTWVSALTFQKIVVLEPYLWKHFNWSIRMIRTYSDYSNLAQIVSVCGHIHQPVIGKAFAAQPAIEIYAFEDIGGGIVRDNWQGTSLPSSWMLPAKPAPSFETPGYNHTNNLKVPAETEKILNCLYGNWHTQSSAHAGSKKCV